MPDYDVTAEAQSLLVLLNGKSIQAKSDVDDTVAALLRAREDMRQRCEGKCAAHRQGFAQDVRALVEAGRGDETAYERGARDIAGQCVEAIAALKEPQP